MFVETSARLRELIAGLDLPEGATVLDVGSSTLQYRTLDQPQVDQNVFAPLRARSAKVTHLDAKAAEGVDLVLDVADPTLQPSALGRRFDLVVIASMLPHVPDPGGAAEFAAGCVAPGGYLLATTPWKFRRTLDPGDNGVRYDPTGLASLFAQPDSGLRTIAAEPVRIESPSTYRGIASRASWIPVRGIGWVPLPGFSEWIRRRVPRWRWRDSIALLQRPAAASTQIDGSKAVGSSA